MDYNAMVYSKNIQIRHHCKGIYIQTFVCFLILRLRWSVAELRNGQNNTIVTRDKHMGTDLGKVRAISIAWNLLDRIAFNSLF
jgi:hypothetical protein